MLGLSTHSPFDRPTPPDDAVGRALAAAGTVSGGYAGPPCAFRPLGPEADAVLGPLRPDGAGLGGWVLVTIRGTAEEHHRVHLWERSLTAAQRFMLALACDGVDSRWVPAVPDAEALQAGGVSLGGQVPVGLVWCSAG